MVRLNVMKTCPNWAIFFFWSTNIDLLSGMHINYFRQLAENWGEPPLSAIMGRGHNVGYQTLSKAWDWFLAPRGWIHQTPSTNTVLNRTRSTKHLGLFKHCHIQWRIQEFPEEGANSPGGGAPTYDFAKFSRKLHEIERIWVPRVGGASLASPRSATDIEWRH